MTVTDKIANVTKLHHKRFPESISKVIRLIRTNRYDPSNMTHVRMSKVAIRYGYIDEDLNVIREPSKTNSKEG